MQRNESNAKRLRIDLVDLSIMTFAMQSFDQSLPFVSDVSDWPLYGLIDDIRPTLAMMVANGEKGALVTLVDVDGPSPRPVGTQMLVDQAGKATGYVSGGCVEGSIVLLAREAMQSGVARRYVFGAGSPFKDIVLVCGSRIEVLIEPFEAHDLELQKVLDAWRGRIAHTRQTTPDQNGRTFSIDYVPQTRLIVLGHDPVALACVQIAQHMGLSAILVRENGPNAGPSLFNGTYVAQGPAKAFEMLALDPWTAFITTTHDLAQDHAALVLALRSPCFYIGALGSKRRLNDRVAKLIDAGLALEDIARLKAPVGLSIGAATPFEIAIAIMADIISVKRQSHA